MAHVFVSYKRENRAVALELKQAIETAGIEAWMDDELRAGDNWREEIDRAIRESFALVVVMTPAATASPYVTYEWACAWGAGIKVIPVLLEPTKGHPRLEGWQYVDLTNGDSDEIPRLVTQLQEIARTRAVSEMNVPRNAPRAVVQAVTALDSYDPNERRGALGGLAQMDHPTAVEALAGAVHHPIYPDVRMLAALHLARMTPPDRRALPGLFEALRQDDAALIQDAESALTQMGEGAVPALIETLHDERAGEISRRVLVTIGAPAVPALIETLGGPDPDRRAAAGDLLKRIGPDAVPGLLETLSGDNGELGAAAADLFGSMGAASVPILVRILGHPLPRVRETAAEALIRAGVVAVPHLAGVLGVDQVGERAGEVLLAIGAPAVPGLLERAQRENGDGPARDLLIAMGETVAPTLNKMLPRLKPGSPDYKVAVDLIGALGSADAVPALVKALPDPDAVRALGQIGDTSIIPTLIEALQKGRDTNPAVADVLHQMIGPDNVFSVLTILASKLSGSGYIFSSEKPMIDAVTSAIASLGVEALPQLETALKHENRQLGRLALMALERIGGAEVIELLLAETTDKDYSFRNAVEEAFRTLANRDGTDVVGLLRQKLDDADWWVRQRALLALAAIGDPVVFPDVLRIAQDGKEQKEVIDAAKNALTATAAASHAPELRALLDEPLHSRNYGLMRAVIDALAKIGDPVAVPHLEERYLRNKNMEKHRIYLCRPIIEALSKIDSPEAIRVLGMMLDDKEEAVRSAARKALGAIDTPEAQKASKQRRKLWPF